MTTGLLWLCLQLTNPSSLPATKPSGPGQVPVEQMTLSATVIGVGTVLESTVREHPVTGMVYTDYRVGFSEVWKGSPEAPFIVAKAGGMLHGKVVEIVGQNYSLAVGESLVFFVHPSQAGDFHVVIGLRAGLYRILDGAPQRLSRLSDGGGPKRGEELLTLPDLRTLVFKTLWKEHGRRSEGASPRGTPPSGALVPVPGPTSPPLAPELSPLARGGGPQGAGESPHRTPRPVLSLILGAMALIVGSLILSTRCRGRKA